MLQERLEVFNLWERSTRGYRQRVRAEMVAERVKGSISLCMAGACAALVVAACGTPADTNGAASRPRAGGSATPSPDSPVTSAPGDGGRAGGGATVISPSEGLRGVRPQPWDKAEVLPGDESLKVFFTGGVPECYGVDRHEVVYEEDRIVVTLFSGRKPGAQVCIELAQRLAVEVHLSEPVEGRAIVDGSRSVQGSLMHHSGPFLLGQKILC